MERLEEEQGIDVHEYLGVLFKRKRIVLLLLCVVFASTAIFTFTAPNVYRATTTLIVESGDERTDFPFIASPLGRNLLQNYCQLLKSKTLAERVVERLRESDPTLSILRAQNPADELIEHAISVSPIRETDLIKVSAEARSDEEAVLIADAIAEEFVEQELSVARGEFTEQRRFLEEQLPLVEERLAKSEEELKKFKESNRLVSLSEETREQTKQLLEFDLLYGQTETEYDATLRRLTYLKAQLAEQKQSLTDDVTQVASPFVLQLRKELVNLETDYSLFLVQGLSSEHPKLLALKKSINEVKGKLREETQKILNQNLPVSDPLSFSHELADKILALEVEVVALQAKKDALSRIREQFSTRLRSMPQKELQLARLEREYEINAHTYSMLMEKYEEVKIVEAGKIANVRIVDRATLPESPVKPKKRLNLALGLLIGLGLGIGAAFLLEYVDTSIRSPTEVEKLVGLPVLGAIPKVKTRAKKDQVSKIASHLITHQVPKSPISETFRTIRTNLQFINPDSPLRTILVTSAMPAEGKTTVAANLAIVLAQLGAKTVLVDSDLRKPVIQKLFGVDSNQGLTDVLTGKVGLQSVILPTEIETLKVLPSGAVPPNPSELLGSKRMKSVIQRLSEDFDYVVFDSPPTIPVTDAAVLGSEVDGTLLVLELGRTERQAFSRAKEMLQNVRASLVGVVLNDVPATHGGYSRYHYYHYYQQYYPDSGRRKRAGVRSVAGVVILFSAAAAALGWIYWARRPESPARSENTQSFADLKVSLSESLLISSAGDTMESSEAPSESAGLFEDETAVSAPRVISPQSSQARETTPGPPVEPGGNLSLQAVSRIFFAPGEPYVRPEDYGILEAVAKRLKEQPRLRLEIRGYSDSSGAEGENLTLSENRAALVAARMIKVYGVASSRVSYKGYGGAHPMGENETPGGRALNRRVELELISE